MLQRGFRWLVGQRSVAPLLSALAGQPQLPTPAWTPAQPITVSSSLRSPGKYETLPSASWNPDMMGLYNEFMEKTVDGSWTRLPDLLQATDVVKETDLARLAKAVPAPMIDGARLFLRIAETEGLGFEYVIFHNKSEKKCVCLFQPGPLLEGLPGIIHGGALGTMIDTTLFMTAYTSANAIFTGTMTITFKSPVILCSTVRLEAQVMGTEGRKVFLSCTAQSSDRTVLFAEASAVFLQMK